MYIAHDILDILQRSGPLSFFDFRESLPENLRKAKEVLRKPDKRQRGEGF